MRVVIKLGDQAQTFKATRRWEVPRIILKLNAGPLVLLNGSFVVINAQLAVEDLLLGPPVLKHLRINYQTILQWNHTCLNETDCNTIDTTAAPTSIIGRILIARIRRVRTEAARTNEDNEPQEQHTATTSTGTKPTNGANNTTPTPPPRVNYYHTRNMPDPFQNPNLIDLPDAGQEGASKTAVEDMLAEALVADFPRARINQLQQVVMDRVNVFRTTFSKDKSANITRLKSKLKPDAKPAIVKLRGYNEN